MADKIIESFNVTFSCEKDNEGLLIPYIWVCKVQNPQPRYMYVYVKDLFGRLHNITPKVLKITGLRWSKAQDSKGAIIVHGYGMDMCFQLINMLNAAMGGQYFSTWYKTVKKPELKHCLYQKGKRIPLPKHKNFDEELWKLSWNAFKTYVKDTNNADELYSRLYRRNEYCPSQTNFNNMYYATKEAFIEGAY